VPADYENIKAVNQILKERGGRVLGQVIACISDASSRGRWPLSRIVVRPVHDAEVAGWSYVLVVLGFNAPFEVAAGYLQGFYERLEDLARELSDTERDVLDERIFFDVERDD